jgi:hypothetical protein
MRISFDWNRSAVSVKRVNPLDLNSAEQIHAPAQSPRAKPSDRDLFWWAFV